MRQNILAERGPSDSAVLIRGLADYQSVFGSRPAYGFLYDTVKTFFDEGGEQVYVTRAVGVDAVKGTIVLKDRATPDPADTLTVNASSAGSWSRCNSKGVHGAGRRRAQAACTGGISLRYRRIYHRCIRLWRGDWRRGQIHVDVAT